MHSCHIHSTVGPTGSHCCLTIPITLEGGAQYVVSPYRAQSEVNVVRQMQDWRMSILESVGWLYTAFVWVRVHYALIVKFLGRQVGDSLEQKFLPIVITKSDGVVSARANISPTPLSATWLNFPAIDIDVAVLA